MLRVRPGARLRTLLLLVLTLAGAGTAGATAAARNQAALRGSHAALHAAAVPLSGAPRDYDALIEMIGDARFVLLGEASHGTHEFYHERARITRRLIEEHGFTAIAIEGNWAEAERVDRYVRDVSDDADAAAALAGFSDFPEWMWRNTAVRDFVEWLRDYNSGLPGSTPFAQPTGFYGLDLYGLYTSADAVVRHLRWVDPAAARRAQKRYDCFEPFRSDPMDYGGRAAWDPDSSCQEVVEQQLRELEQRGAQRPLPIQSAHDHAQFSALQNARVVRNAEEYYRVLFNMSASTRNLRDRHMAETLGALARHYDAPGRPAKIVAWAHNTHMGDARATQMGEGGEWNVGQLMRERHGDDAVLVGFTTYTGTVMAAQQWGSAGELKNVRPALDESFAGLFHSLGLGDFLLPLRGHSGLATALAEPRLERAIGVIYLPQTERISHYFEARLSRHSTP